jgi:hypothetical protein
MNPWDTPRYSTNWEKVEHSSGFAAGGDLHVSTWRLRVPGGWLYKVTEWDEDHPRRMGVCFVPEPR